MLVKDKEKSIKLNDGENSDIKKSNKQNVGENNDKEKSIKPNDGENSDTKKSNKPNVGEDIDDIEKTRKRADPPGQQNFFSFFMQQQRYSKLFETMITFLNEYGFVYIVCMLYTFYRSILNTKLKNNTMHPETLSRKYKSSKKRRKKAINMKIKILFYIWMVTQPQGNDGPIITLILLTAIKGKLNVAPQKLNSTGHFQVDSPATNRCWHNLGGVRFSAQHDDNMEYGEISKKNHNKKMHSLHGNRAYSLMHINKGPSDFKKKMTKILQESKKIKPQIINISEANVRNKKINDPLEELKDYKVEHPKQADKLGRSRNIMLIDKKITYKRRKDLESEHNCSIWIEVETDEKRTFLICGFYRQWTIPKKLRKTNQYTPSQRLKFLMDGFKKASKENKDIVSLSDTNIDTSVNAGSGHKYISTKVEKDFYKYIEENELMIMNEEYTRFMDGQDPSCIDHIITNSPKKLKNVATHVN